MKKARDYIRLLFALFILIPGLRLQAQRVISAADFGALPNDMVNDRAALQKAIDFCKQKKIHTLRIPPGRYRIADTVATRLMKDALSGRLGRNPQDVVFKPYFPYISGLQFKRIEGLTVEADGVFLMAEGWMEPVTIEDCQHITIRGLTIDYSDSPHSEGGIIKTGFGFFDIKLPGGYDTTKPLLITRIMYWDSVRNRLLGNPLYFPERQQWMPENVLRISTGATGPLPGNIALINHGMHFRPAILIQSAVNTLLERVTIHAQPGMGIVGNRSENIIMNGLRIVPRAGNYQSTNTDATHFTACKGLIRFNGCSFEGQGDDATNVHGYYHDITAQVAPNTYTIQLDKEFTTHAAVLDYPDAGDTLELVSKRSLQVAGSYRVIRTDTFPGLWKSHVQLDKALPEAIGNYYLINISRLPRLEFVNSNVSSHLARAVLVKTRNVLIENNIFRETTGTAVHIGAEGDWREGPGSAGIVIRNNRFIRCGRGDGANGAATAIAINVKAPDATVPGIHKNIIIEGNIIEGEPGYSVYGIAVAGAQGVEVRNNEFADCRYPWQVHYSKQVYFRNNYQKAERIKDETLE
ncbi:right-handed parallel beta-helix repeat-containing protein [Niabella sp. CC-SYL272]|uniref:right-handed parallel beta-helix repeat-containing protein n=1 Tax=Niabella agricola TaxID=2891571 RepID=UPI001F28E446|nr:right-handed parallel beta-helix repeat-containing protein [Niabella agricola]MCF3107359.1 right-handed parallel beta-helix repeat-containing protein [Niabella agricola]